MHFIGSMGALLLFLADSRPFDSSANISRTGITPSDTDPRDGADVVHDRDGAERALILKVRQGDGDAFATFMRYHLDAVTRIARAIVGSTDAADDIVQNVFVQMWAHRDRLDPDRPIKSYLHRAIRNCAFNDRKAERVRAQYRTQIVNEAASGTIVTSTPSAEGRVLAEAEVTAALQSLSERRRIAIQLRFESDLSYAEIGEVIGTSGPAAMQLVLRGIEELRRFLKLDAM